MRVGIARWRASTSSTPASTTDALAKPRSTGPPARAADGLAAAEAAFATVYAAVGRASLRRRPQPRFRRARDHARRRASARRWCTRSICLPIRPSPPRYEKLLGATRAPRSRASPRPRRTRGDAWSRSMRCCRRSCPPRRSAGRRRRATARSSPGRLSPEKGAIEAIDIARAAGLRIDVYGDPYDADYTREQIDPRRGEPGVAIHDGVPRAAIWEVMACAEVVLCPARWEEPFGMVAAEAQACGTPVVAFRRGALDEVIVDRVTGFLVSPTTLPRQPPRRGGRRSSHAPGAAITPSATSIWS